MKIKLIATTVLTSLGTLSFAASVQPWSVENLSSYSAGTEVTDGGKTFKCKPWPYEGWCSNAAYRPTGQHGTDAWENTGPGPSPTPTEKVTATVTVSGDIPASAQINFVGSQGTFTVSSGEVNLEYPKDGSTEYTVKLQGADGSITPDKVTVSANTTNINLSYTAKPAPTPGDCDPIPSDVKDFVPNGKGGFWSGYNKGAFVKFDGNVYELLNNWWTSASPAEDSSWVLCQAVVQADVSIKTTGLPKEITSTNVVIGGKPYTINPSQPNTITLGKGSYDVSVDKITSQDGLKVYTASKITPNPIVVTEDTKTVELNIEFKSEDVKPANVTLNVSYPNDAYPEELPTATVSNSGGYEKTTQPLIAGDNIIEVPSQGKFTITPNSYKHDDVNYSANPIEVINGKIQGEANIKYNKQETEWPARSVVGYVRGYDAQWTSQPDTTNEMITEAMKHGYNVIVYAFAGQDFHGVVDGKRVDIDGVGYTFFSDKMKASIPEQQKIIHDNGGISLLSIGGGINYFTPDMSTKAVETGKAMGKFLADNGYDGLDIDVEHPTNGAEDEANFMAYINAMKSEYKSITGKTPFLTAAPQISGNTGSWSGGSAKFAEAMYTQKFMDDAHFDAVFIQTYNQYGGAIFFGKKGVDVGFLTDTFNLLSEQTRPDFSRYLGANNMYIPEGTKVVLGVPDYKDPNVTPEQYNQGQCLADASCSGVGLYEPSDIIADIEGGDIKNYSQYGGLMTWILNSDSYQGWTWVDGIKDVAYN